MVDGAVNATQWTTTMAQPHPFAIPLELRQLWASNLDQGRSTYRQFFDILAQASGLSAKAMPTGDMAAGLQTIQTRIIQFAMQNADAYFLFAAEIAEANDIQELLAIQHRYMTTQMQAITSQAQEIARVIAVATQRM